MNPNQIANLIVVFAFASTGTFCALIYFYNSCCKRKGIIDQTGKKNDQGFTDLPPSYEELFEVHVKCEKPSDIDEIKLKIDIPQQPSFEYEVQCKV